MMDAADRELFEATVRQAVAGARTSGAGLDPVLADVGWSDALALDERVAVAALFEAQGASAARSGALGAVVLAALEVDVPDGTTVVLPPLDRTDPPGRVDGTCVPVAGVVLGAGAASDAGDAAVVVAAGTEGDVWGIVPLDHLAARPVQGLDPDLGLVRVGVACAPALDGWAPLPHPWALGAAAAQRALAHELVGSMRTMLDLARTHALERIQFDRPIAGFQAVRHRLADAYVAVEAAEAALDAAWLDGTPWAATVAKAVAGQSAAVVRRHCQQVLAGIGFTTEHELHRHLRRTLVLDPLLGDARTLTARIGADLLAARAVPPTTAL